MSALPLTLGYAGSVAYGYGEELVRLIPVLREVGARIRMFSPKPSRSLNVLNQASDVVEICGYRPALEAWREIQETCDAVILPYMNPAECNELLYRTHFPSKLTEYLALGMPVIVSGPVFATGVKWARGEGREARGERQGISNFQSDDFDILKTAPNGAVPCTSREELVGCLQRLRSDAELRMELAKRASGAGRRDFDPVVIRRHFVSALVEACNAR
jgi:glycosyltransferase involved in cell wall biosynthesis